MGEFEFCGGDVLLEPVELRCAGDRGDPGLLREYPCERDLGRGGVVAFGDRADEFDVGEVRGASLWIGEAGDGVSEVAAGELGVGANRAGEEAFAERAEGDEADAELLEGRQDRVLRFPPPERVLAL